MRRRSVLLGAAACAAAAPSARTEQDALLALFADRAGAAGLGRTYAAANPAHPEVLARAVLGQLPHVAPLRTEVGNLVRQDYAAGRIACVDGWILSLTEARLCALAASA